jgi:hypothetical protein
MATSGFGDRRTAFGNYKAGFRFGGGVERRGLERFQAAHI